MKIKRLSITLFIVFMTLLFFSACKSISTPRFVSPSESTETLDVVLLGTYGYTTVEELGRTIEDYDQNSEYDSAKLPDTQVGFKMILPITFFNQGKQSWSDPHATLLVMVTTPNGTTTNFTLAMKDAMVQRRRYSVAGPYLTTTAAQADERRLSPEERRVFFFGTSYVPLMPGIYTLLVELHSSSLGKTRIARSGFTVRVHESTAQNMGTPDY